MKMDSPDKREDEKEEEVSSKLLKEKSPLKEGAQDGVSSEDEEEEDPML